MADDRAAADGADAAAPASPTDAAPGGAAAWRYEIDRYWLRLTLLAWATISIYFLYDRWNAIYWLQLIDTDDNMRLMQVRGLLGGQGWFDLRNYRLNPPLGFDIHWSRLVDLPIAAMILLFRLFTSNAWAERLACGIAPLLPLSIAMLGLSATVRRLVSPLAWPLAVAFLVGCVATMNMFMPERIDHHGWQLAMLSATVAGLCDPRPARGGLIVGLASAVSLAIGLEMLPYAAMAGAILTLRWVWDRAEAPRLTCYALALGAGTAAGYAAFASDANRVLRCDALTPVYLSVMVVAGTLLFVLARWSPADRWWRLGGALAAAAAIVAGFAWAFPQCLGRPEQVSPELTREWLDHVREARPIYTHPLANALPVVVLPIIALIGSILGTWRAWGSARFAHWLPVLLFSTFAGLLLLWQARAGPAAQMLAVPGAVALAWIVLPRFIGHRAVLVRVFGSVVALLIVSGLFVAYLLPVLPVDKPDRRTIIINRAGALCPTISAMAPLDRLPPQTVFTLVDLGPRLITVTHHDAIAGPYHRNGDAILDVQHAFIGTPDQFRAIARRHGASLLLLCPNMAESTIYRARAPDGFYSQMAENRVPKWLTRIPLPSGSPLRLYRIVY